jgi:hypothetical protein
MVLNCQFALSSAPASAPTRPTIHQPSSPNITPPTPPAFSGPDMFYTIMALSVLVRVIVSPR